ncbi:MAG: DUF1844 domain-containing protein [Deltaproteobacteria bacterium]|nr:DUF1844 domain-containing protein [Deltaproteobacteria bacterium]
MEQTEAAEIKQPSEDKEEAQTPDEAAATEEPIEESQLPEINFATFIFSLNSSALVHLGMIEDPATSKNVKSLPLAKQTIDILGMLEEKTQGNLSTDEENLLKNILHDLRLMYVREKG